MNSPSPSHVLRQPKVLQLYERIDCGVVLRGRAMGKRIPCGDISEKWPSRVKKG